MSKTQLLAALDLLKQCDCQPSTEMEMAHQICQDHEGNAHYDWVHALVHRIEGDDANAAYWYRRADKLRHSGPVEEELRLIRTAVEEQ